MLTITLQKQINGAVLAFKGSDCVACWSSFHSNKPDYRYKHVILNCYRYKVDWDKTIGIEIKEIKPC